MLKKPQLLSWDQVVRTDYRLLEVDEAILKEIISTGVVIKGSRDAEAILTTKDKSFAVKLVETTNSLLIVQPQLAQEAASEDEEEQEADMSATQALASPAGLQTQVQRMQAVQAKGRPLLVNATATAHLELCESRPQLQRLHQLLSELPYGGQGSDDTAMDVEGGQQGEGIDMQPIGGEGVQCHMDVDTLASGKVSGRRAYTFDELLAEVQASELQLCEELAAMHAVELDGAWRAVDRGYMGQLLELLILSAQAEGMRLDALDPDALYQILSVDGYRSELVRHCLKMYGAKVQQKEDQNNKAACQLDDSKVCQYFASKVLTGSGQGVSMPMQRFMAAWRAAVPADMHPQMPMLKGEVLLEGKGSDVLVRPFPVSQLPVEPSSRFALLFAVRAQWEATDLEPFLAGLQEPGQTAGALLLKYARASQPHPEGPIYYTAR